MQINWLEPSDSITDHFTVHEALWLPNLRIHHIPTEAEKREIIATAESMELVRQLIGRPMMVTSWLRPEFINGGPGYTYNGQNYNSMVPGSARHSLHITGKAMDFVVPGMSCDDVRDLLRPELENLQVCLEDMPFGWIHLDRANPTVHGGTRTFKV